MRSPRILWSVNCGISRMSASQGQITRRNFAADVYLLTWASGVLDALCYLRAGVFTANMTGNTVVLGLAIVGPGRARVWDAALAILAFAVGALIGALVLLRPQRRDARRELKTGVSLELPFAAVFSVLWAFFPEIGPAWLVPALLASGAAALGIQSVAARRLKLSGVVTTFITGTITTAIVSFLERDVPGERPDREAKSSPLVLGGMVVLYAAAAMTGAALTSVARSLAPLAALLPMLAVLVRSFQLSTRAR